MTSGMYTAACVEMIKANQAVTGAYIASPTFAPYRYAWLRDGSFIAYAMDRMGEHESARLFYLWCGEVICKHQEKVRRTIEAATDVKAGANTNQHCLHARYTIDGEEVPGAWGHFQLDGYGAWLWGLAEHLRITHDLPLLTRLRPAIELTIDYLSACWQLPHFDCWEEGGDHIYFSTLAAVFGGCKAISSYLPDRTRAISLFGDQVRRFVWEKGFAQGIFRKSSGNAQVDASLIWLALPFGLVDLPDHRMRQTVQVIERELSEGYGVHRYRGDTYYGGGIWLLLSAWLGWYYVRTGERRRAGDVLRWIEGHWTEKGFPEQVQDHLLFPEAYNEWLDRAGPVAAPLLWSHAMYLILACELAK